MLTGARVGCLIAVLSLAGCVVRGDPFLNYHRRQYLAAHPELAPEVRAAIDAGRVIKHMSWEEVMASLGPPESCSRGYGATSGGTVCLYADDSTQVISAYQMKTLRSYTSVYFENGKAVDWQSH